MTVTAEKAEPSTNEKLTTKIDEFLADISHQAIVEASRVQDFALDMRLIIKESNN